MFPVPICGGHAVFHNAFMGKNKERIRKNGKNPPGKNIRLDKEGVWQF